MPVANPYTAQLGSFRANLPNARRGLTDLYRLRERALAGQAATAPRGFEDAAKRITSSGTNALKGLEGQIGDLTATLGQSAYGGGRDDLAVLDTKAREGIDPYRQALTSSANASAQWLRSGGKAEAEQYRYLREGVLREQTAAQSELESGVVDITSNLQMQAGQFAAQQQLNAQMAQYFNAAVQMQNGGPGRAGVTGAAQRYLGIPYVWGGTSTKGFDCSGLTQRVYADQGVSIPRTAAQQFQASRPVRGGLAGAQPGDLIFYANTGGRSGITHVALYIGNGQVIEARRRGTTVSVNPVRAGGAMVRRP